MQREQGEGVFSAALPVGAEGEANELRCLATFSPVIKAGGRLSLMNAPRDYSPGPDSIFLWIIAIYTGGIHKNFHISGKHIHLCS